MIYPLMPPDSIAAMALAGVTLDPSIYSLGVVLFQQDAAMASILGSSTPDGLTPIDYTFDPSLANFSAQLQSDSSFMLDSGPPVPFVQGASEIVTGTQAPEPGTWTMLVAGAALIGLSRVVGRPFRPRTRLPADPAG
jgi:hypothetical protein